MWVAATDVNTQQQVIAQFNGADGSFIRSFNGADSPDGVLTCPSSLAVDNAHRVYVVDNGHVDRYSDQGVFGARVEDSASSNRGLPLAVAADPVSGEVYVAEAGQAAPQVTQFTAGGDSVLDTFDVSSNVHGVRAIAVNGTGTVYIADATDPVVERFVPFAGPTVTTDPPSDVEARSATLNGSIIPEGASSYHFEYSADFSYGTRTPEVSVGSGKLGGRGHRPHRGPEPELGLSLSDCRSERVGFDRWS